MNLSETKLMLVGCGAMGSSLLRGWIRQSSPGDRVTIVTPRETSAVPYSQEIRIDFYPHPSRIPSPYVPDIVVFAVKPQILGQVLKDFTRFVSSETLFVSIAAGKRLSFLSENLGARASIVRVMPNLPAAFGKGMTVAIAGANVSEDQQELADELFQAVGILEWIEDEKFFDAVTAISGCGPAYLYLLVESLTSSGEAVGLPTGLASIIARQAMIGAGELLDHSKIAAGSLKKRVASPGGATEAALKVLEAADTGLPSLMHQAILAATRKSQELSE